MNRRHLVYGGVAAAAAAAGVGWSVRKTHAPGLADLVWQQNLTQPAGGELAMASLRGKPLLLNFWATWCPPCVKEMPMLDAFYQAQRSRGWQVVGLAVDSPTPVREFLKRVPVSFPIGLAGMEGSELSRALGNPNGSLPFTVVLNAKGDVVVQKLGSIEAADLGLWARAHS
jgi:thiol-disulfide isomerase/thioredoxin